MGKITVLVADGQLLFSECLVGMLATVEDLWVLEERPSSAAAAIESALTMTPDVVLLDHWLPGMAVPVVLKSILSKQPRIRVLVLSWFHGPDHIHSALRNGASGFLPKSVSLATLLTAIRAAHKGEVPVFAEKVAQLTHRLSSRAIENIEIARRFSTLTTREIEVLKLLATGGPIDEVADRLSISPHTLKTHIRNILGKTGARSHAEAVGLALRCGLIQI